MTRRLALAAVTSVTLIGVTRMGAVAAGAQEPSRASADGSLASLGAGRVAAQVVGGAAALPVGYVAGGLATRAAARLLGASDQRASQAANVGAYVGSAVGVGGAVSLIGARGPGAGSLPAAIGGAAGGLLATKLLARALRGGDRRPETPPCRIGCLAASAALAALPSVGATVAYDVTRRRR